jgi:hypothetical protein
MIGSRSYEFHRHFESPFSFFRREWQALAVFGGGFAAIFLVGVFASGPAYFYPRLRTDSLDYYLKGLAFVETGRTTARSAINVPPFPRVAMPGLLRSPFMLFHDFDTQLRAIQLSNILLVGLTAAMYAYVLSWIVPRRWHWLAIGFSFGFMVLNPEWGNNVFVPLADAPYAAASIAFLILAARVLSSDKPLREHRLAIVAGMLLFAVAFFTRYTAPVLLVYVAALAAGRRRNRPVNTGALLLAVAGVAAVLGILLMLNWHTMSQRYLIEPWLYLLRAEKSSVMMNVLASALPSQIVPDFQMGFARQPLVDTYHVQFGTSPRDLALVTIGIAISATTFFGMWRSRDRFAPEIVYTLAALPVLALMIPSTERYLIAYEPLFWIFFYAGASVLVAPLAARIGASPRTAFIALALSLILGVGVMSLRSRILRPTGNRSALISIGDNRAYATEVTSTFVALRGFLDKLPREQTLLIGPQVRWKAISGLEYYRPDSALVAAVANRDMYLVLDCGTLGDCQGFDKLDARYQKRLARFGSFSLDPMFARTTEHAKARVYRIRNTH